MSSRTVHRLWRESATLMIIGRNTAITRSKFDYRVLLLQRSSKSRFMPGSHVFPGGVIENADFADEWMDLYHNSFKVFGSDFSSLLGIKGPRPPIFRQSSTSVPSEVAFRICAIRETFEESGVLLVTRIPEISSAAPETLEGCVRVDEKLTNSEIHEWRKEVHNDPTKFITLCRHLDSVPDVWSLSEWSNWLTPTDMKIRFDTAFFICFCDHEPPAQHDDKETVQSQWKTPGEAVIDTFTKKYRLAPPQLYTMLQLSRMTKWDELKTFQESRAKEGCTRILIVRIKCSDGIIGLFPGDDLYPKALDYVANLTNGDYGVRDEILPMQEYSETCEELEAGVKHLHRFVQISGRRPQIKFDCSLGHTMLAPVTNVDEFMKLVGNTGSKI